MPALPPALHAPRTIGLIAPASAPTDPDRLARGITRLEAQGFTVVPDRPAFTPHGYLCGTDAERRSAFNAMLRRTDVDALFCVRGGYGALRLLPGLDYAAARRHPKLLVGYSDITALHLALYHRAGWRGLSGPMVGVEWSDAEANSEALFWALAHGATPAPLTGPHGETLSPYRPGTAIGPLLGGNLSVLVRLLGTPYLPDLDGTILFLEDVGEAPYRIDGMLAHLRLAGVLDRLGGLVLGGFTDADPPANRPSLTLDDVFRDYLHEAPFPVARGLVYGHFPVKNTMPVGVRARLQVAADHAVLEVLTPVVRP